MADNKYTQSIQQVQSEIRKLLVELDLVDKKMLRLVDTAAKVGKGLKITSPEGLKNQAEEMKTLIDRIDNVARNQTNKNLELLDKQKKKELDLQAVWERGLKKRERQKSALAELSRAYNQVNKKRIEARNRLRDLIVMESKNTKEVKKAQREYDKYTAKINKANKATSNFSKTGLGGMVRGFQNLLGAFGLIGGATLIATITKDVFNLIKTLESIEFALKTVTSSSAEYASTQQFLADITTRFGLNIVTTTERFTKFLAAAKQSNVSFTDTTRIFESVSKASAVLGLKTHELTGVYLALEQMLSKGKVTTEELRRQLGERLPGAMGIMADAMDVSISQLDKMLKKGEVLSSEALPKFAAQLEKAYGIEAVKTVDTLVSAQQRLTNAWVDFVEIVNTSEGRLSTGFKDFLNLISEAIVFWGKFIQTAEELDLTEQNEAAATAFRQGAAYAEQIAKLNKDNAEAILKNMIEANEKTAAQIQKAINFIKDPEGDGNFKFNLDVGEKEAIQELEIQLASVRGSMDSYRQVLNDVTSATRNETEELDNKIIAIKGSIVFLQQFIKKLEEKRGKLATTTEGYRLFTQQIEEANAELLKLTATFENSKVKPFDVKFDFKKAKDQLRDAIVPSKELLDAGKDAMQELSDRQDSIRKDEARKHREHIETLTAISETMFETFADVYDIDLANFKFLYDGKLNSIMDWSTAAKDVIGSVLDVSLERYDIELQAAQRAKDLIVNNSLATEKEKRLAREKFEQEERRIKTKRAKADRTNTIIKIAVDTAAAIAATLAPPPLGYGPLLGVATIPIIAGIGAAQAALVAAQPLPKFAEGTKAPLSKSTFAITGDGGKAEAITMGGKLLGVTPDKPTLTALPKGAEVQEDAAKWINEQLFNMNMVAQGKMLSGVGISTDNGLFGQMKGMREDTNRTWSEVKNLAKRPINVTAKVESSYDEYVQ